jgi:ribosomal protein S18 acetylase RimI-like enzyme
MDIKIEQLKIFSTDIAKELNNLYVQLNPGSKNLSEEEINKVIEGTANRIIVARTEDNKIIGMMTLIIVEAFSSKKGLFEDLVVDGNYQKKGIGTKLVNEAIRIARQEGIRRIDFTSNPERVAANRLYEHLGFKKRNTNVYRIEL